MKIRLAITVVMITTFLLDACGPSTPSASEIAAAVAQTQVAAPTATISPTSTPIPLANIDLEPILVVDGDLPTRFIGGQIKSSVPTEFPKIPVPDQVIRRELQIGEIVTSGVEIFLYEDTGNLEEAYNIVTEVVSTSRALSPLDTVGAKAMFFEDRNTNLALILRGVIFVRCHALVTILLADTSANADVATAYAQRLDKRLLPLICR